MTRKEGHMFKLYKMIVYSGVAAFVLLVVTVILGITGINFNVHMFFGKATFAAALVHVGLIVYKNVKLKMAKRPH